MKRLLILWVLTALAGWAQPSLQMTSAPSSVQSGTGYYIEASCWDSSGGVTVTIYKNGSYFASTYGTSPVYVGGNTTDYGAQTVEYRIEAVNDYWQTDTIYHYVTIIPPNNPPAIQWVNAPANVPINQNFTVQAKGTDQDGNLTNVFVWREWTPFAFNGGGNGYENTSDANGYSQGTPGTVTFQASAKDSNNAESQVIYHTVTIYVPNQPPTITWINAPASAYVNQSFNVQARGDDPNGNLAWVNVWKQGSPFAFNGGGNGYQSYSDNNPAAGTTADHLNPGYVQFSAQAGDSSSATSGTIYHNVTINNRAPNTPSIAFSGAGLIDLGNGQFAIYNEPPNNQVTATSTMTDPDGNLANHTIYYQQVTGANPDPGGWITLTSGTPSGGASSTVSTTQTMLTPGRWDFHVNGHDGVVATGGASLTLYVYGLTNNASFEGQSINGVTNPTTLSLNPGQTVAATVTMKNTGTKPWNSDATPHRLGSQNPSDNTTWGMSRVALPVSTVNPPPQSGDTAAFSFNITAPTTAGNHVFQWRMVEDGIAWFGSSTTAVTIAVNNVAPTVVSATGGSIEYGQTFSTTLNATDINGDLANFHLVVASASFNAISNNWEGTSPDGWKWLHFRSDAVSGGNATITVPVQDNNYGTPNPLRVGTYRITLNAQDSLPNYTYSAANVLATLTVSKSTPNGGAFASRSFVPSGSSYTVQAGDLDATFANIYSGSATAPTGAISYSIVGSGTAVTAGTQLAAGQVYTIRATYAGDSNYTAATKDATWTITVDPNADDDNDGMSNGFEQQYFGSETGGDPTLDPDGDGLTNVAEYNLGTNPTVYDAGTSSLGGTIPAGWPNAAGAPSYVVGMTAGSLEVDKNGAATYSIPLWVVPGTAGMEPKLALNYSSQAGAGWLGYGWSVSGLSAITRGPQTMALDGNVTGVNYTASDRFYLDGQRLIAVYGTYGDNGTEYRTEIDSISKIVSYGSAGSGPLWFKVWTKSGLIIELGNTTDSAVDAQGRSEKASWAVNKISDTSGNTMEFVYNENTGTGEHRIDRIDYTRNTAASLSPYASVRFVYENRPDTFNGYVAGSKVARTQRIKSIGMYYGETKVRDYVMDYTVRAHTGRSILTALHEKDGSGAEYPPLTFDYDEAPATGIWDQSTYAAWAPPAIMGEQGEEPKGTGFVDLNGDGRPDFVQFHQSSGYPGTTLARGAWLNDPVSGWVNAAGYYPPAPLAKNGTVDSGARFADLNSDGLVDFINLNNGYAYLNTGSGFETSANSTWSFPTPTMSSALEATAKDMLREALQMQDPLEQPVITSVNYVGSLGSFLDLDHNGRPDFVGSYGYYEVHGTGGGNSTLAPVLVVEPDGWSNTGSGWTRASAYGGVTDKTKGARFADLNADGHLDNVQHWYGSGSTLTQLYLGNGAGWTNMGTSHALIPPLLLNAGTTGNDNAPVGTEMADLNGDGLIDLVARNTGSPAYDSAYLGTGTGWEAANDFRIPYPIELTNSNTPQGVALLDINSDGLVDIVQGLDSYTRAVRMGTGSGWSADVSAYHLVRQIYQPSIGYNGTDFVDLNADGAIDQVWHWKPTGGSAISGVALNQAKPADRLITVTNGFDVSAQITYAPLTERDGSGNFTVYDKGTGGPTDTVNVIGPMYVVKTVSNDDGAGGQYAINYRYGGLRSHLIRGNLGFEWMQATDSRTGIVAKTTFKQEYPYIGLVASTETKSGSTVLSASSTTYADKNSTGDVRLPYAATVTQSSNDLNGAAISASTTTTEIDAYGNATSIVVADAITSGYSKTTTNQYTADNVSLWLLGRLTNSTVASAAPGKSTLTRTSSFTYHATTGLLLTETVEPGDSTLALTTTYGHDAFGNRTSVTVSGAGIAVDTNGTVSPSGTVSRQTTYQYDTKGRFPEWKRAYKDGSNYQQETYVHDQQLGVVESLTGPNGLTTEWTYNSFGVKTGEERADGTVTGWTLRWAGSGAPTGAHTSLEVESTGSAPSLTFNDNFGRAIWALAINGDGTITWRQTAHDNMGRAYATTNPYRTGDTVHWSQTTGYDALNRPLSVQTPHDSSPGYVTTSYSYNGTVTSVTDAKGRVTRTTVNSQGQVTEVVRNYGGAAAETGVVTYDYDALGNLTTTVAGGVTTTLGYDLRGRKTAMTDPDMGAWQYRYNIFGELIWQKDAKGQITTLTYDGLGRLVGRVETEGTTTWTYDTSPTKGLGKLHTVSAPGGYGETHTYDSLGRPAALARTISGETFTLGQTYDSVGRPEKTVYPTGFQTKNVYNAFGYLKEVRRADSGRNDVYWQADRYDASGRIDGEFYGNGTVNDRIYSAATGRLLGAAVGRGIETGPPYSIQYLSYTHDQMGNVNTRHDAVTGREERFYSTTPGDGYDGLDRLKVHTVVGGGTVTVSYDAMGNITAKSDVGTYSYGANAGPHAVTGVSGGPLGPQSYTYDANGNMTGGGGRTITWTSFNQVETVVQGSFTSTFSFGANHERVKQVSHLGTTVYAGGVWERFTDGGGVQEKNYVMAPTGRVAVVSFGAGVPVQGQTRYFHTDGLGSITAVTDEAGRVVKRFAFDAWGKRLDPATGNTITGTTSAGYTRGFTDHEQLDDFGLIHMNGRVYDPVLGRFLSADPFVDGVTDSQGYNRYSYVGNNPLSFTDPTGHLKFKEVLPAVIGVVVAAVAVVTQQYYVLSEYSTFFSMLKGGLATVGGAITGGAAGGFASGFSGSLLNGGSLGDAFRSGAIGAAVGAAVGWATHGIGGHFGADNGTFGQWAKRTVAHALVGGVASEVQGGQFRHGFYSSFASAGTMHMPGVQKLMGSDAGGAWIAARTTVAATIGGTASVLAGGKFANGAVTSAFQHMFNAEARRFPFRGPSPGGCSIGAAQNLIHLEYGNVPDEDILLKAAAEVTKRTPDDVRRRGLYIKDIVEAINSLPDVGVTAELIRIRSESQLADVLDVNKNMIVSISTSYGPHAVTAVSDGAGGVYVYDGMFDNPVSPGTAVRYSYGLSTLYSLMDRPSAVVASKTQ